MAKDTHSEAAQTAIDAILEAVSHNTDEAAVEIVKRVRMSPEGPYDFISTLAELSPEMFGTDKLREYADLIDEGHQSITQIFNWLD